MQGLVKGAVFGWGCAATVQALQPVTFISEDVKSVLSGSIGGLVQGFAVSPLLLLKTRVMTNPVVSDTSSHTVASVHVTSSLLVTTIVRCMHTDDTYK